MKENLPSKWKSEKCRVPILVSDKTDFKPTKIEKDTIMVGDFKHPTDNIRQITEKEN